jgi:type IV secretion system protein VirB6
MVLVSVLVFLVMRQVMPIASGLASGVSLNSFGTVSRLVMWSVRFGRF